MYEEHERDVLTVPEAGRKLGLGACAAYGAAHRGEIPVLKLGRRLVVPKVALEKMLAEARHPSAA